LLSLLLVSAVETASQNAALLAAVVVSVVVVAMSYPNPTRALWVAAFLVGQVRLALSRQPDDAPGL
jgi:hypothetical protein